ncbi:DUF2612 domain-containing protein [Cronobacter dublinensis]|uniref:DUF2612 domain-containing protein n=1 Tax=Cronobacter dublinensis TaxID=413497 RepID=UPI0024C23A68|nr:DUF2612 domain-containing protein [Cronobacter dublinensis]MDK1195288.1 DUF2612 domain-containing protein [Cronobacter dublinensis]MDK1200431.1 DUF2612 domain-containing protein [Cronobacter dublinensis]
MWKDTVLTQYSASKNLLSVIDTFCQAVCIDEFTEEFISDVWDLTTCGPFGLDMWGKFVGVSRYVIAPTENESFGFGEANGANPDYPLPFDDAPFFSGIQETTNVRLGDDAYRTLILCKAFSNLSVATIPEINVFLKMLFYRRGRAYCSNYRDMTLGLIFEFELAPYEKSILTNYDVIPVPGGVMVKVHQIVTPFFGFTPDAYPFNDGTFCRD